MDIVARLARQPQVKSALAYLQTDLPDLLDLIIAIQQIPAPTFQEAKRAAFVNQQFAATGLQDITQDDLHTVYGRFPGPPQPITPPLIISAHTDTVFPAGTDLSLRRNGRSLHGPGIADNAAGVAGLIFLAHTMQHFHLQPERDIWFVANTAEEGLGDLAGIRAVVERFGPEATYIVVEGGLYGQINHQAIAVRRYRIDIQAPGGHSWGAFGASSAIHELGRLIAAITQLEVPNSPRTTYNVGLIEGGTSINTIAQTAALWLDLRSEDGLTLETLVRAVQENVHSANERYRLAGADTIITMTQVGSRPAGQIPRQTPLVQWAAAALQQVGCKNINFIAGSTDANIPLSLGGTAVCIGLAQAGNTHRLDEYLDVTHLHRGMGQLLLLTLAAGGLSFNKR